MELLETAELLAFVRTVEAGSLTRAAKELGIPRATLSRRLARLEETLGVRVLRRTTRRLSVTDAGQSLMEHAATALAAVREAVGSVRRAHGSIRGTLRFSTLPLSSRSLDALVCGFLAEHPDVRLHVSVSTDFVSFGDSAYDVALRAGERLDPGLISRTLLRSPMVALASPEYLRKRGTPTRAADLAQHACILGFGRGVAPNHYWPLVRGGTLRVEGVLATNDVALAGEAVKRNLGVAFLPLLVAQPLLDAGDAVPVLRGVVGGQTQVAVIYPERELLPPVVRAFVEALVRWAKTGLAVAAPSRPPRQPRPRR